MRIKAYGAMLATGAIMATAGIAAPPAWQGSYMFEQSLGQNLTKEVALFVNHRVQIGPKSCRIDAEGYQTDEHLLCTAIPRGDAIELRFRSYADGSVVNRYGVKLYKVGQPLFTLSHKDGQLMTTWQGYIGKPDPALPGSYFIKG